MEKQRDALISRYISLASVGTSTGGLPTGIPAQLCAQAGLCMVGLVDMGNNPPPAQQQQQHQP